MLQNAPVQVAFERHDQVGEVVRVDPFPVAEFGMLGGDVHVAVFPKEAREVPVL